MRKQIQKVPMRSLTGKTTLALAFAAGVTSAVSTWIVPLGGVWVSLVWASAGCVACLWVGMVLADATASIGDVIARVEAESPAAVRMREERIQKGASS